jgi:hypothetical protein
MDCFITDYFVTILTFPFYRLKEILLSISYKLLIDLL